MLALGKIDHIHIYVHQLKLAQDWYHRVLGLIPDTRYKNLQSDSHSVLMLVNPSGSIRLALAEVPEKAGSHGCIAFTVSGQAFMEWLDQLAGERVTNSVGIPVARDSVRDHHFFYAVSFIDPAGNAFELVSYDHTWLAGKLKQAQTAL